MYSENSATFILIRGGREGGREGGRKGGREGGMGHSGSQQYDIDKSIPHIEISISDAAQCKVVSYD